jgi:exodeoxyribonuclease V beta subunit
LINDFGPSIGIPSFPVESDVGSLRQEVAIDCYRQIIREQ